MRWILNTPGFFGKGNGDGRYDAKDLIMLWDTAYTVDPQYKVSGILKVWRDYSHFRDLGKPRSGSCHAFRKGRGKSALVHAAGSVCINGYGSDESLIESFNRYEHFVCYDDHSLLPALAALCGCRPIIVHDGGVVDTPPIDALRDKLAADISASAQDVPNFVELCGRRWR